MEPREPGRPLSPARARKKRWSSSAWQRFSSLASAPTCGYGSGRARPSHHLRLRSRLNRHLSFLRKVSPCCLSKILARTNRTPSWRGAFHREVLSNLAKIADLKVISRTSVMRYKPGTERNLKEIAGELGVVEGSVQRDANRVRVTADLIEASTNSHLWAETYDGDAADILQIQGEIAQKITRQLDAKLTPGESAQLAIKPARDLAAHENYIRARAFMETFEEDKLKESYTRAVQLLGRSAGARSAIRRCILGPGGSEHPALPARLADG